MWGTPAMHPTWYMDFRTFDWAEIIPSDFKYLKQLLTVFVSIIENLIYFRHLTQNL